MSSGMWYRTLVYLGLKEEPEVGYDELPERRDAQEQHRATARSTPRFDPVDDPDLRLERAAAGRVVTDDDAIVRPLRVAGGDEARLAVVDVALFDDVQHVGGRYREGRPVLFDVSAAERADARRVIDFVAGLTFALRGRMHRVGSRAFLLVPEGTGLHSSDRERLRTLGYRLPEQGDS